MKFFKSLIIGFAVAVAVCVTAGASASEIPNSPSIPGPTGLVMIPSAYILSQMDYDVSIDVVGWQDYVKMNIGLPNNIELGMSFIERTQEEGAINLKWNFVPEAKDHPAVSLGVTDAGSNSNRTKYFVASKNLTSLKTLKKDHKISRFKSRIHVAYRDSDKDNGFMYGTEVKIVVKDTNPLVKTVGKTTLIEEYDGDHFNFGLRYELSDTSKLQFGILKDKINLGVSFRKNL